MSDKSDLTDSIGFSIPWTAEDSATLRHFLTTVTGRRMLGQLLTRRPVATNRTDAFRRSVESAVIEGYEDAVRELRILTDSTKSVKPE